MFADTLLIVFISVCTALLAEGESGRGQNAGSARGEGEAGSRAPPRARSPARLLGGAHCCGEARAAREPAGGLVCGRWPRCLRSRLGASFLSCHGWFSLIRKMFTGK